MSLPINSTQQGACLPAPCFCGGGEQILPTPPKKGTWGFSPQRQRPQIARGKKLTEPRPDTTRLQRMARAYAESAVLYAALDLELFTHIAAGADRDTPYFAEGPNDLPMPPLPYASQMSGPPEHVRQAYIFAAQNPGVLEYVPCYCGCELDGHCSNVDRFVISRTANGAAESWDNHGMT